MRRREKVKKVDQAFVTVCCNTGCETIGSRGLMFLGLNEVRGYRSPGIEKEASRGDVLQLYRGVV